MAIVIRRKVIFWSGVAEIVYGFISTYFFWPMSKATAIDHIAMWTVLGIANIWQSTRAVPAYDRLEAEAKIEVQKKWLMEFFYMVFVLVLVGLLLAFVFEVPALAISLSLSALACVGTSVLIYRNRDL